MTSVEREASATATKRRLSELAVVFLRLGTIGFGGPAAHVALMEEEVVRRRRWIAREEFLDLLAATNLIPGPNSTEMAIHVGRRRAGMAGLIVAGVCFILPAATLVAAAAWLYVEYGSTPSAGAALRFVKPAIIAVVVQAVWLLGRTALRSLRAVLLAAGAFAANLAGVPELTVVLAAGAIAWLAHAARAGRPPARTTSLLPPISLLATGGTFSLGALFLVFLKIGSVLFGSGYVLIAFLRGDLVQRLGWLTEAQLLDAVAVGQVTPGPVFTTATFIGYVLGGWSGAALATIGIFLPAFVLVALSGPLVPRLRRSAMAGAVLDGVVAGSLGVMAAVTVALAPAVIVDAGTAVTAVIAAALLIAFRVSSAWLVAGAAVLGFVLARGR